MSVDILRVTDTTTRTEIEHMILRVRAAQRRAPRVMTDRIHARYDQLLTDWQHARG